MEREGETRAGAPARGLRGWVKAGRAAAGEDCYQMGEMSRMDRRMQANMAEATRLTRQGRLAEATALIQRTLGGAPAPDVARERPGSRDEPIEAAFRVVDTPAAPAETPTWDAARPRGDAAPVGAAHPASAVRRRPGAGRLAGAAALIGRTLGSAPTVTVGPDIVGGLPRPPVIAPAGAGWRGPRPAPAPAAVPAGGRFVEGSYTNPAGTRAYKLYIPSGYAGQAAPLIVMLHGCTQSPADFAAGTGMNLLAEGATFLVAYPEQAASANGSKCWNWFKAADQQRGRGEPSLIAGITRQIMAEYQVDPSRVYVAGLSAGGAMAVIMGTTYPDLYAAVGVHSGLPYGAARDLPSALQAMQRGPAGPAGPTAASASTRLMPTIVFHGDRDTTVNKVNGDRVLAGWAAAGDGWEGPGGSARQVTVRRGQAPGGHAYTCSVYHDADGRALMEQWLIHGAGHAWSGGSPDGSFTDPKGPDASAEMARFFREHPRG